MDRVDKTNSSSIAKRVTNVSRCLVEEAAWKRLFDTIARHFAFGQVVLGRQVNLPLVKLQSRVDSTMIYSSSAAPIGRACYKR